MSLYTPITVTPVAPAGSAVTLPMPESVQFQGSSSISFVFKDPWPSTDLQALLQPVLSQPAEKILTGRTLLNKQYAIVSPPGVLVDLTWGEAEPFDGGTIAHAARGVLALPTGGYDRSSRTFNVVLYVCSVAFLWGGGSLS